MVSSPQAIDTSPHHYMLVVAVTHELICVVLYEVMIYEEEHFNCKGGVVVTNEVVGSIFTSLFYSNNSLRVIEKL